MITIGITTYNRLDTLKITARSLQSSNELDKCNIRVYDDASTEYETDILENLFPNAKTIKRNKVNLRADGNMYNMYKEFLETGDEILINADADLIFSKNWIKDGLKLFSHTDGVLSLYNSIMIQGKESDDYLLEKPYIGAAGAMLSRECVEKILNKFSLTDTKGDTPYFDWRWCRYLREIGHNIYCVKKSLAQHIGVSGQNSSRLSFDYGIGFNIENIESGQIVNDILLKLAIRDKEARSWYALLPFYKIPKDAKIVIYGYGSVGKDYVRQIKSSDYCKLEAIVDENYSNINDVLNPNVLANLDFDFIVVAMLDIEAQYEIKDKLLKDNPSWKDKIIVHLPKRIEK